MIYVGLQDGTLGCFPLSISCQLQGPILLSYDDEKTKDGTIGLFVSCEHKLSMRREKMGKRYYRVMVN